MNSKLGNFTKIPNKIIDCILGTIPPTDFNILIVIFRLTEGWNKKCDAISYSQFQSLTGIKSKTSISNSLKRLEELQLIRVQKIHRTKSIYSISPTLYDSNIDQSTNISTTKTKHDESNNWTSDSPNNLQDVSMNWTKYSPIHGHNPQKPSPNYGLNPQKTSPNYGHTKDNNIKETTTNMESIMQYIQNNHIKLELNSKIISNLCDILNDNDLDISYIGFIYNYVSSMKIKKSISGYFIQVFPENNLIQKYKNESINTQPEEYSKCPICYQTAKNGFCSSCEQIIYGLSDKEIAKKRAIHNLSQNDKYLYYSLVESFNNIKPSDIKGYSERIQKINDRFGIPNV